MADASLAATSPREFLQQVSGGLLLARALGIAADLRVAERVTERPMTVAEVSRDTGADSASLFRVLRFLSGYAVFAIDDSGRIEMTPCAELLHADHPDSLRDVFALDWQNIQWATYAQLPDAVMHGDIAFERAFGDGFFDYLSGHRAAGEVFDRRMAAVSRAENPPIAEAYPFGDFERVVDIGGGRGGLLAAILQRHPRVQATLFEQPQVLAAPTDLASSGLLDRVDLVAGDFFAEVPAGGDLYVMKRVIHDWDDDRATQILRNCRRVIGPEHRIVVVDAVIRPGNEPDPIKDLDLGIMALTPGKERTAAEFERLFARAGLRLTRVIGVEAPALVSIVEAELA